jgi:hypothetical protein
MVSETLVDRSKSSLGSTAVNWNGDGDGEWRSRTIMKDNGRWKKWTDYTDLPMLLDEECLSSTRRYCRLDSMNGYLTHSQISAILDTDE